MAASVRHPIRIGRVIKPHGVQGEMVVRGSGLAAADLRQLGRVRLVREDGALVRNSAIESVRPHVPDLLVRFQGVKDPESGSALRGLWLEVERSALPDAGPGQVYYCDLIGLEVIDEGGTALGRVESIVPTGAHEVLVVRGETGEILIPYHAGTILGWDPAAARLTVRLPDGLLDIYKKP